MKTLRVTIIKEEVGEDQDDFNLRLTEKFIKAGFDLDQNIIHQKRSDIEGMDFIQYQYTYLDTVMGRLQRILFLLSKIIKEKYAHLLKRKAGDIRDTQGKV